LNNIDKYESIQFAGHRYDGSVTKSFARKVTSQEIIIFSLNSVSRDSVNRSCPVFVLRTYDAGIDFMTSNIAMEA